MRPEIVTYRGALYEIDRDRSVYRLNGGRVIGVAGAERRTVVAHRGRRRVKAGLAGKVLRSGMSAGM